MDIPKKYPRLKINGMCRHFKEVGEEEPMIYLVTALAKPLPRNLDKTGFTPLEFVREDKRTMIKVYKLSHNYFMIKIYARYLCSIYFIIGTRDYIP